jgi:hypothetical protein
MGSNPIIGTYENSLFIGEKAPMDSLFVVPDAS